MNSIHRIKGQLVYVESLEDLREFMDEEVFEALSSIDRELEEQVAILEEELDGAQIIIDDLEDQVEDLQYQVASFEDTGE